MSFQQQRGRGWGKFFHHRKPQMTPQKTDENSTVIKGKTSKNISKHDNNCCREISISLDLSDSDILFFEDLKYNYNLLKRSPPVIAKYYQYMNNSENPYISVLRLLYNCQEFYNVKTKSLPMFIVEEFKIWSVTSQIDTGRLLTAELKIDTFKTINKQNNKTLTKFVFELFQLTVDNGIFVDSIMCMVEKKQYKEACQNANLLNLHNKFTIDDFLVPLVLQDKLFVVDEFLDGSKCHQMELVVFLDSVLANPSVRVAMVNYIDIHGVPEVKYDKINAKPWKKLLARLVKMFKLSSDLTPNLNKRRTEGAVKFLLHKRFIENGLGDESWKEMVEEAVGTDEYLQKQLVYKIAQYGEFSEALRWAEFYHLDKKDWPYAVRMLHENPDENRRQLQTTIPLQDWDNENQVQETIEYHKFPMSFNSIHLIDSENSFEIFLDNGLQDVDVVGIDCEWKPTFAGKQSELALMQIATRRSVAVLDVIKLGNKAPHLWQELNKFLFNNCDILKLGFSLSGDFTMIRQTLPELSFISRQVGFLDLCSLWKSLGKFHNFKLPYEVQSGGASLSTLVHHCLGRPLDKSDQFSNWEKRPLRDTQLQYAALDAYCLIQVYDVMKRCCDETQLPFDETCYNLMENEKAHKKKTTKKIPTKKNTDVVMAQPPSPHETPVMAHEIRMVCDATLQGLGKHLRRCGIDTKILDSNDDHQESLRIAQDSTRYILSRSALYTVMRGYVPPGHCLRIISDNLDEQLQEVLDYYKITVTKSHVFTRCQTCNGNNFVKLSRSTMNTLVTTSQTKHCPRPACFYEDEATGFSSDEELCAAPSINRKWELCSDEKVDVGLCQTRLGVKVQVDSIPHGVIENYDFFYVCEECGKVYYDGTHFECVLAGKLRGVVH